jgi:hypothetical protein
MLRTGMFAFGNAALPVVACAVVLLATSPGRAEDLSSSVAVSLGEVLGAEDFCGLTYDQAAVKSFMDKNVRKDDADFASTLRMVTGWTKYRDGTMSVADKTDECSGIAQTARSFGLIR